MDIKIELDHKRTLCQGCLSSDRKITALTGTPTSLFFELIGDRRHTIANTEELLLCWECKAILNKLGLFQRRIRNAHYVLTQYLHSFCQQGLPQALSTLQFYNTTSYNLEITHRKREKREKRDKTTEEPKINETETSHEIIKEEALENMIIKQEDVTETIDNTDFYDDTDYNYDIGNEYKIKKNKIQKRSVQTHATVRTNPDICFKDMSKYYDIVHLSEAEIEDVINKKVRSHYAYHRLMHKCKECKIGYKKNIDMLRHITFHHSKKKPPHICLACKTVLATDAKLEEHWRIKHTEMLRCVMCSALSKSTGHMRKHLNKFHTKIYTCTTCNGDFDTARQFSHHYKKCHNRFVCDYCGRSSKLKKTLESHIRRNHLPPYCSVCKRYYAKYNGLETHTRLLHPELKSVDTRKELCYCVECDRQFSTVEQYRKHLRTSARHTPKKKLRVPCPDCGKVFTRTNYMNNHYKLVHMRHSKHFCAQCNKYFVTAYALRIHTRHVHEKKSLPKDKICDLCGRGFSTNRILENHRRTHTGERPFKCKFCPASFAQKTAMNTHQKTQHKHIVNLEITG